MDRIMNMRCEGIVEGIDILCISCAHILSTLIHNHSPSSSSPLVHIANHIYTTHLLHIGMAYHKQPSNGYGLDIDNDNLLKPSC